MRDKPTSFDAPEAQEVCARAGAGSGGVPSPLPARRPDASALRDFALTRRVDRPGSRGAVPPIDLERRARFARFDA